MRSWLPTSRSVMVLGKRATMELPWNFHIRAPMLRGKKLAEAVGSLEARLPWTFNMRAPVLRGKRTMGSRMRRLAGWQTAADNTALLNLKIATAHMQQQEREQEEQERWQEDQEDQEEQEEVVVPWMTYLQSPRLRG